MAAAREGPAREGNTTVRGPAAREGPEGHTRVTGGGNLQTRRGLSYWNVCGGKFTASYGPFTANTFQVFSCTNYNVGPGKAYSAQTIAMSFTNNYYDYYRLCFQSGSACSASSQTFSSAACNLGYENAATVTNFKSLTYTCTNVSGSNGAGAEIFPT